MLGLAIGTWVRIGTGAALVAALIWSHWSSYQAGRAFEQSAFSEQIRKENADASQAAENWRARYRLCLAGGGLYDFETGACKH